MWGLVCGGTESDSQLPGRPALPSPDTHLDLMLMNPGHCAHGEGMNGSPNFCSFLQATGSPSHCLKLVLSYVPCIATTRIATVTLGS